MKNALLIPVYITLFGVSVFAQTGKTVEKDLDFFTIIEDMPKYPGGEAALLSFIGENTVYPPLAKAMGITGVCYVSYTVQKDGSVDNVYAVKGAHPKLDKEAIRVVSSLSGYEPGMQKGKPVPVQFTIPIRFTLELKPGSAQEFFNSSIKNFSEGNEELGSSNLDRAIEIGSHWFIQAYLARANRSLKSGNLIKALKDFNAALKIDPTRSDVLLGRAKTYYGKLDLEEAIADLESALKYRPNYSEAYEYLGKAHMAKGDFQACINNYDLAIESNSKNTDYYYRRGHAYARLKKVEEACQDWKRAKELGSTEVDLLIESFCSEKE